MIDVRCDQKHTYRIVTASEINTCIHWILIGIVDESTPGWGRQTAVPLQMDQLQLRRPKKDIMANSRAVTLSL
jgi:hypothetical protein